MAAPDRTTLSGIAVSQAMRRQIIRLNSDTVIDNSINTLIKYKISALLVDDPDGRPIGVLSKTDVMGAYYAGLPIESPLEDIMSRPPLFCRPQDALEEALRIMRANGVYRLYVMEPDGSRITGVLAYPDIVGLLYQYCHECEYSHLRQKKRVSADPFKRFFVHEIMTPAIQAVFKDDTLHRAMEELSMHRFGALLVRDRNEDPCGVISKTDLTLAYKHGIDPQAPAASIMSTPVQSCDAEDLLENAIRKMIFSNVHRLFVHQSEPNALIGVFSLSDAARIRSGSCQACISSRIKIDP